MNDLHRLSWGGGINAKTSVVKVQASSSTPPTFFALVLYSKALTEGKVASCSFARRGGSHLQQMVQGPGVEDENGNVKSSHSASGASQRRVPLTTELVEECRQAPPRGGHHPAVCKTTRHTVPPVL